MIMSHSSSTVRASCVWAHHLSLGAEPPGFLLHSSNARVHKQGVQVNRVPLLHMQRISAVAASVGAALRSAPAAGVRGRTGVVSRPARRYATNMTEQHKAQEAARRANTRKNARKEDWETGESLTGSKAVILMLSGCTVLGAGYNVELLRQRKETNALMRRRMDEFEAEQNAAMGVYDPNNMPSEQEIAAQKARAAKLLADMQQRQRDKDESKEKRKALWRAKQASIEKGGKSSFQIKGDPDNQRAAAGPGAGGATIVGGSGAVQAAAAS
jgi:hypothetical protein